MTDDPIVGEIRAIRDAHAKAFDYDIRAIVEDLKKQERESGEVHLPPPIKRETERPEPTLHS